MTIVRAAFAASLLAAALAGGSASAAPPCDDPEVGPFKPACVGVQLCPNGNVYVSVNGTPVVGCE